MTEPEAPKGPQQVSKPQSRASSFFSHPVVATLSFVSAIAGLIGLPLSFYFYYAAKEYPQLSYYVSPAKAVVVKAGQASKLTTSYDDKVITTDITAAQVALWNAGGRPIKGTDVLKPVTIYIDNSIPILEATVRKTSREVIRLEVGTQELQQGRATVSWNLLEHGDGGVVQLIYAGDPSVKIYADGVIEGQPELVQQTGLQATTGDRSFAWNLLCMAMFCLAILSYGFFKFGKRFGENDWLMMGMFLVCLIGGLFVLYLTRDLGPPFGL